MYHPQSVNQQEPVTRQPVASSNRVAPNTQTRQPRHGGGDQQIVLEEWNFGLFSCFSFKKGAKLSTCCWTTFCPCVTEWRIALRLGESCLYPTINYSPMSTCNPCGPICGCIQGYLAMSTRFTTLVGIKVKFSSKVKIMQLILSLLGFSIERRVPLGVLYPLYALQNVE